MEDPSLHPPRHNARTAILIALLLSYAFLMSRDLRTIGKQGDSLAYYASAQSFSEKGVFLLPDGTPNIIWPPGYSLALSLYAIEGISIGAHARLLQILYYMLIAGGAWLALESACRSGATNTRSIFYWAAFAFFPPQLYLLSNALSEMQYTLLTLVTLYCIWHWRRTQSNNRPGRTSASLAFASIACGCALMTRLQGLLLVAAGMILIFSCHSGSAIRKSVTAFLWASPSALMLGWWLASNHSATGRFRPIGEHPLGYFQNASSLGLSTFAALVPIIGQSHLAHAGLVPRFGGILLIYLPLLAALGALIRLHWVHKRASGLGILGAMLATYALIDLIGLPILASIVRVDQMHYRFLYPALTCALISVGLIYVQSPRPAWMRIGLLCAALCWSAWGLIYVHYYSKGWSF